MALGDQGQVYMSAHIWQHKSLKESHLDMASD